MEIVYVVTGFCVGIAVGLTGIGGGALMTPILVLGFKVPVTVAVATDLVYAALTKSAAVFIYARRGAVRWQIVRWLLAGSVPGSLLTVAFLDTLSEANGVDQILKGALGAALALSSLVLLSKHRLHQIARGEAFPMLRDVVRRRRPLITGIVGFLLGVLVTLSSVGAGTLGTAALIVLFPGLSVVGLVGTELAHAVVLASVAGLGYWTLGNIDYNLLLALLAGSLPGVWLGGHLGFRLPERIVRPVIAGFLVFLAVRLVLS